MQVCKGSNLVKTNLEISNLWSCQNFIKWNRLQNWKLLRNRNSEEDWLYQFRYVVRTLQHSIWSNALILSLLSLSRGTNCSKWIRLSTWSKKEGSEWNAETQYRGKSVHCCRNVGIGMVETLQNWWVEEETLERIFRMQVSVSREYQLLDKIKSSALFGYLQCDMKIPEHLKVQVANFSPIFKNTNACKKTIGSLMQKFAEKQALMSQPRQMVISSFELTNGTTINPLLLFYMELRLVSRKVYRLFEFTPVKFINILVQEDENPKSSVVAETIKLLAKTARMVINFFYHSRHSVTK